MNEMVTPSEIIRKSKEIIKMTDGEMSKSGRWLIVKLNDMLTVFNYQENKSRFADKAIMAGMNAFVALTNGDYASTRRACEIVVNACEESLKDWQEYKYE